ncbi:MAG: serine hydrolase domain-containing protein, partial [Vicinamibacteraceae bacterium]
VLVDGRLAAERYFNGATTEALHDIRSAGKSVTSLLVGIAHDQGRIESLQDRVSRYLPRAEGRPVGDITIRDLLTMRSGLDADDESEHSAGNEARLDAVPDPVAFALAVPSQTRPGKTISVQLADRLSHGARP